jgi:hypothetical protein
MQQYSRHGRKSDGLEMRLSCDKVQGLPTRNCEGYIRRVSRLTEIGYLP